MVGIAALTGISALFSRRIACLFISLPVISIGLSQKLSNKTLHAMWRIPHQSTFSLKQNQIEIDAFTVDCLMKLFNACS